MYICIYKYVSTYIYIYLYIYRGPQTLNRKPEAARWTTRQSWAPTCAPRAPLSASNRHAPPPTLSSLYIPHPPHTHTRHTLPHHQPTPQLSGLTLRVFRLLKLSGLTYCASFRHSRCRACWASISTRARSSTGSSPHSKPQSLIFVHKHTFNSVLIHAYL